MRYYVVDAFADELFQGNPAGVCPLESWLPDSLMQNIAMENNLAETAFVVDKGAYYELRWFTPETEIELCGHATLATAFVLNSVLGVKPSGRFEFRTLSGPLFVEVKGDLLEMDFPARAQQKIEISPVMRRVVNRPIVGAYAGYNLMLELENQEAVADLQPDFTALRALTEYHGLIVSARGRDCDFVSRFFAPLMGVSEDPVTGSSHTSLVPFWAERLNKRDLVARQLSRRGGTLYCRQAGDRVHIAGRARLYLVGEIQVRP